MSGNKQRPTDIFIHIPKTAGTTLMRIMERSYPRQRIYRSRDAHFVSIDHFAGLPQAQRQSYDLLSGHMPYGVHPHVPRPYRYFTMLRDPVERVISYFYFIRTHPEHYLHEQVNAAEMSLETFVRRRQSIMVDNLQTRFVSGAWVEPIYGACDAETLARAQENLRDNIVLVGLTERFDESLLLLRRRLGWRNIYYTRHNVTQRRPSRDQLPASAIAAIAADNQLDAALYAYAETLFAAQIAAYGDTFAADLARFRALNKLFVPLRNAYWRARQISVRAYLRDWLHAEAGG